VVATSGVNRSPEQQPVRSGNTRALDLGLASNRFVLLATPLAGGVAGLITLTIGDGLDEAVRNGISAGGAVFICWALARELDPDNPWVAVVAAIVAPLGLLITPSDLLAGGLLIVVARVAAFTTGRAPYWIDVLVIAALSIPLVFRHVGPGALLISAMALGVVSTLQDRRRVAILTGAAVTGALGVWAMVRSDWAVEVTHPILVTGIALGLVALLGPSRVLSPTDRAGGRIPPHRVRLARAIVLFAAVASSLTASPAAMAPVWSAVSAVGVGQILPQVSREPSPADG
jgi:hypothetical protein